MWEFLQAYGTWILFGVFFIFMLRMHAGGGCGMSHEQPSDQGTAKRAATEPVPETAGTKDTTRRGGGCH